MNELCNGFRWDGDADKANRFLGDRYGVDWEYGQDGEDLVVNPAGESLTVRKGEWVLAYPDGTVQAAVITKTGLKRWDLN